MISPSLERCLRLPVEPCADETEMDESTDCAWRALDNLQASLLQRGIQLSPRDLDQLRIARDAIAAMQLAYISDLDDWRNWGNGWRHYAQPHVPAEIRVRHRLETLHSQG